MERESRITDLLAGLECGQSEASARLLAIVYPELHAIASRCMRGERPGHTLQATVLVHEAWIRLAGQHGIHWENRMQFFSFAAMVMRRVLVDYAREHRAMKRYGGAARVELDDVMLIAEDRLDQVLSMDASLRKLSALDAQQGRIVELRFFAGMTVEETSALMGISTATVKREWSHARAWLQRDMSTTALHAAG